MIGAVPDDIPVTAPAALTVAIATFPEVQVPPVESSVRLVTAPEQTVVVPDIAAGKGLTTTEADDDVLDVADVVQVVIAS